MSTNQIEKVGSEKIAEGWCWNDRTNRMELYQNGVMIQVYLCRSVGEFYEHFNKEI